MSYATIFIFSSMIFTRFLDCSKKLKATLYSKVLSS